MYASVKQTHIVLMRTEVGNSIASTERMDTVKRQLYEYEEVLFSNVVWLVSDEALTTF